MTGKLRRSEMFSGVTFRSYRAGKRLVGSCYKQPAPTEPSGRPLCGILYF